MKALTNILYSYDPNEFLPIYIEGKWSNRSSFVMYKTKRAGRAVADHFAYVARTLAENSK